MRSWTRAARSVDKSSRGFSLSRSSRARISSTAALVFLVEVKFFHCLTAVREERIPQPELSLSAGLAEGLTASEEAGREAELLERERPRTGVLALELGRLREAAFNSEKWNPFRGEEMRNGLGGDMSNMKDEKTNQRESLPQGVLEQRLPWRLIVGSLQHLG